MTPWAGSVASVETGHDDAEMTVPADAGTTMGEPKHRSARAILRARPLLGSTLAVAAVTAFAKLNGGVREILVARHFGTSRSLEAFLVAFAFVSIGIDALVGGLPSALIPTILGADGRSDRRRSEMLGAVLPPLALLAAGLVAATALAAPLLSIVIAGGFDPASRHLVADIVVILAPTLAFGLGSAVVASALQSEQRFMLAGLPSIANPVTTIIAVVAITDPDARTLAWAFCAGYGAELLVSLLFAAALGISVRRPDPSAARPVRRVFFRQLTPICIGLLVLSSMTLTDQAVSTHFARGQVAVLAFGIRIPGFVAAVGMAAVGAVVLPQFSRLVVAGDRHALRNSLRVKQRMVLFTGLGCALALCLVSRSVINLVFAHGEFDAADAAAASGVLAIAAWQIPAHLLAVMYTRMLSARLRNRAVLVVSVVAALSNLASDLVLGAWLGARGVALATTLVVGGMAAVFGRMAWSVLDDAEHGPSRNVVPGQLR